MKSIKSYRIFFWFVEILQVFLVFKIFLIIILSFLNNNFQIRNFPTHHNFFLVTETPILIFEFLQLFLTLVERKIFSTISLPQKKRKRKKNNILSRIYLPMFLKRNIHDAFKFALTYFTEKLEWWIKRKKVLWCNNNEHCFWLDEIPLCSA